MEPSRAALGCSRVVWVKQPCQGDTPQLSRGGLSGDELSLPRYVTGVQGSCKYNCYRPPGWSRTAVSWRAIAGVAGRSAIKETCNTLTNGYTAVAKLTMTSPPLLSGEGDNVQKSCREECLMFKIICLLCGFNIRRGVSEYQLNVPFRSKWRA